MRRLTTIPCGLLLAAAVSLASATPARSAPQDQISLLQTLFEWTYPGSKMLDGARMSDAGIPPLQAVNCEAVLSTPDPIEKVIAFYIEKFKTDDKAKKDKALSVQEDSKGRPVTVRVFVVNKAATSTTLVISRADGEKETHIAWSHFIRLNARPAPTPTQFSLGIYSGREDPIWDASEEDVRAFTTRFDALKPKEPQEPLAGALGYHGFWVKGFRSYDRIWVWKGTVEVTEDGKTFQLKDDGRALEKLLLEHARPHVSDQQYKIAAAGVEKN